MSTIINNRLANIFLLNNDIPIINNSKIISKKNNIIIAIIGYLINFGTFLLELISILPYNNI